MPEPVRPQVERVKREMERRAAELVAQAAANIWADLVDGTPVDTLEYTDTPGVLRGNWNFSIGAIDETFSEGRANPYGPPPAVPAAKVGDVVYMTNHAPYAEVIEYGGYPNPVMRGSFNRATKQWVKKSLGGFSLKAPSGWVRIVAAQAQAKIDALLARLRNG